jgi:hypothetical protein
VLEGACGEQRQCLHLAYSVEKLGEYLHDAFCGGPLTLDRIAIVDPGTI